MVDPRCVNLPAFAYLLAELVIRLKDFIGIVETPFGSLVSEAILELSLPIPSSVIVSILTASEIRSERITSKQIFEPSAVEAATFVSLRNLNFFYELYLFLRLSCFDSSSYFCLI